MKDPIPINLSTPDEIKAAGWAGESRDGDGHLLSSHAPLESGDDTIADWIIECTSRGETVTFFPKST